MPRRRRDINQSYEAIRLRLTREGSPAATTGKGKTGPTGPQGPAGPKGVTWKGAWATGTDYEVGDIVTEPSPTSAPCYGSALITYLCLDDHTSVTAVGDLGPPQPGGTNQWHELTSGALIVDGLRAMTCNLDMDSHEVDNVGVVDFDPTVGAGHTHAEGGFHWDDSEGIERPVADVLESQQLWLGNVYLRVRNVSGTAIPAFRVVSGEQDSTFANVMGVQLADRYGFDSVRHVCGVSMHAIADGDFGWVCAHGVLNGVNTSFLTVGQLAFLNGDVGDLIEGDMDAPNHGEESCAGGRVRVGWAITSDNPGSFFVDIERTQFLTELQDFALDHGTYSSVDPLDVPQWVPGNPPSEGSECNAWRPRPSSFYPSTAQSGNYTIQPKDVYVLIDASGGDVTVTLPYIAQLEGLDDNRGRDLTIKKVDSSLFRVIIEPEGTELETIDGEASQQLKRYGESVTLHSDGQNWSLR